MKAVYAPLGFAIGASAAALVPRDQCCFGLSASGGVSGQVGQLSDGQNRIAQTGGLDKQTGQYCLNNGQITDGNGRGCILTPPTTQFQCDTGATPTGGFSVSNGNLAYNGNNQFYACPTGDNGGYNIYTTPVANQQGCVSVTLSTGGKCSSSSSSSAVASSSAPASSKASSSAPTSSAPASSAPASSAPASSAPASSAPASSAPATTAPAASPKTSTIYSTHYETITSCGSTVTNCPAESTVTSSTVYQTTSVPAATSSAPASSAPASSTPASSAPASSAPASSAPASSAPASSAPASSAPASSVPASSSKATSSAPVSSAPATSAPATSAFASSSAPASSTKATSASGSGCATALTGAYQTPHAIIPVNSASPDKSYGTQYFAYLGSGNSTIFNFDIPQSYSGKQCSVIFLFPEQKDLETSSFTTSGSGSLTFSSLSSAANLNVSYNTAPKVASQIGQVNNVTPGNSYSVATGSCAAGTTQSIEVSASSGYSLSFFEDWNPSPIGVFITSC